MALAHLKKTFQHNLTTFRRHPLSEISGSLGDLGTFLPILIALTEGRQISLSTTLIFTGAYNIVTGAVFGIPLPVQPMKAIAAVAILRHLTPGELAAAGLFVSACILVFGLTGLLEWFTGVVPIPVVKGIQVGAGVSLIIAAGSSALGRLDWVSPSWADNYLWLIGAFVALFVVNLRPRVPYALMLTVLGVVFMIVQAVSAGVSIPDWGRGRRYFLNIPWGREWEIGIVDAGLGQLPLTTLNSVIAVTHLAADLLPEVPTPSVTSIGLSVSAMNIIGVWFGVMPVCHGSGGLAAQYRFGARSGASIIFLGVVKLALGLLLGDGVVRSLQEYFPTAFLSILTIAAGLELASVGESLNTDRARDVKALFTNGPSELQRKQRWTVMMVTAGTLVAFKNDAVGFIAGLCCHFSYQLANRFESRRPLDREQQPLLS